MAARGALIALQLYVILRFLNVLSSSRNSPSVDLNHQRSTCERFYGLKCRFGHEILAKLTRCSNLEAANERKTRVMLGRTTLSLNKYLFYTFLLLSNDVDLNPGPNSPIFCGGAATGKRNNLRISTFNARSIVNKRLDLRTHVTIGKQDVIGITETWLNDSINDLEILPSTFTIHRKDREGRGGGALLAVRSNIQCFRRMDLETDCELLWCEVFPVPSYSYFIGVFYRPPNNDLKCLQELAKSLEKLEDLSNRYRVLLLGDFNLPDIDWNVISPLHPNQLSDFFCDCIVNQFCLTQVVDSPTRSDSILDLILTDSPENIMDINIGECLGSSDHNIINFTLVTQVTRPLQPSKLVYNYKNANWDCFRTELSSAP